MTACYVAIGSTYTADGWTPDGPLFSVFVPTDDQAHAIDYARRHATHGPDGLAMHGAEDVIRVEAVSPDRRRPRNAGPTELPIMLPAAPDKSVWKIVAVKWEGVMLQPGDEEKAAPTWLSWTELRSAAAETAWYRGVLRRCEAASY